LRETSINLILSLDDLYNAVSNRVNESLATAIVSYLARRINDEGYIKRAGFNLLLYRHNKLVQRKLHEFIEIFRNPQLIINKELCINKGQAFITNYPEISSYAFLTLKRVKIEKKQKVLLYLKDNVSTFASQFSRAYECTSCLC
jgi:hypothetical protein